METEKILVCDCNSTEHQIVFRYDKDDNLFYCHIHLTNKRFFNRLISGIKYIFGYKCKYGHWDEFIFKPEHYKDLFKMAKILNNESQTDNPRI